MKGKLAAVLAALLFLSGCMPATVLGDRELIQAVGIDMEDGKWTLSFLAAAPDKEDKSLTETFTAEGETLGGAFENAELKMGRRLFCGHNKIIIIGGGVRGADMDEMLSLFAQDSEMRADCAVAAAENAGELFTSGAAGEAQRKLAFGSGRGGAKYVELMELIAARQEKRDIEIALISEEGGAVFFGSVKFKFC